MTSAAADPADWPDAAYYRYWMHMAHHDNPAHYGIRTRDLKLIFFYGLPLDAPGVPRKNAIIQDSQSGGINA